MNYSNFNETTHQEFKEKMYEKNNCSEEFKKSFEQFIQNEKNLPLNTTGFHLIKL